MSVCDNNKLSLYMDGMLNSRETRLMEKHLSECGECRAYLAGLEEMKRALEGFEETEPPEGFHAALMDAVRGAAGVDIVAEHGRKKTDSSPRAGWGTVSKVTGAAAEAAGKKRLAVLDGQFWARLGTVAAGLLITIVIFGGLGSFLPAGGGAASGSYMGVTLADAGGAREAGSAAGAESAAAAPEAPVPEAPVPEAPAEASAFNAPALKSAPMPTAATAPMADMAAGADEHKAQAIAVVEYDTAAAEAEMAAGQPAALARAASPETQAMAAAAPLGEQAASPAAMPAGGTAGEQTVKQYTIDIEVDDFNAAVEALDSLPGYNTWSDMQSGGDLPTSSKSYSVSRSVAQADYERVKSELGRLGKVMQASESSQSVFASVADVEARIRARGEEVDRLFELLEKSGSAAAMARIESQLEAKGRELDDLRSQRMEYGRNVAGASVSVNISYYDRTPRYKTAESFGERLGRSFILSLNGTFAFIENAAVFVSSIGFPLIIILLAVFIIRLALRMLSGKRGNRNE